MVRARRMLASCPVPDHFPPQRMRADCLESQVARRLLRRMLYSCAESTLQMTLFMNI